MLWEQLLPGLGVTSLDDQRQVAETQASLDRRLRDLSLVPSAGRHIRRPGRTGSRPPSW